MYSATDDRALPRPGCPIRISPDHSLLSSFPEHFAASHVLHRLLAPRHPPYALPVLTKISPLQCIRTNPDTSPHAQDAVGLGLGKIYSVVKDRRSPIPNPDTGPFQAGPPSRGGAKKHLRRPGGADRDRTDDLRLAKPALSQLSYSPVPEPSVRTRPGPASLQAWWAWVDSNYRPPAYQADALTD
jgi:hypothetical protein